MNTKKSSNLLFENIIKFLFFAILVAFICDGGAGRGGCGGSSAAWSREGCGGSSVAVERGRVRGVGGGARWSGVEGAGGARRRGGPDLARWDSDREMEGDRDQVSMKYTLMAHGEQCAITMAHCTRCAISSFAKK